MKAIFFFSLLVSIFCTKFVDLTDATFEKFIETHQVVMIEFYSPGCKRCKAFAPVYDEVSDAVAKEHLPYILARVDINTETKLADTYAIGKLPILGLFLNGKAIAYQGESNKNYMMIFIKNYYKQEFPYIEIKTEEEFKERINTKLLSAIMIGGKKEDLGKYSELSKEEEIWFFHTTLDIAQKVLPEIKTEPSVFVLNDFDEKREIYTEAIEKEKLKAFIEINSKPKVSGFNQEIVGSVFKKNGKKAAILLREADEKGKKAEEIFMKLAIKYRSEDFLFVLSGIEDPLGKRVAKMMSVSKSDLPVIRIVETKKKLEQTKFEGEFTLENVEKFISDWKAANAIETQTAKTDL